MIASSASAQFTYDSYGKWSLYYGIAPYPKTPFSGEFTLPRIKDVDSIAYLRQVVGGQLYYTITRSADGLSDIYWETVNKAYTYIWNYDEEDRLLSVVREYTDTQKHDTLMLYRYDEQGRIRNRSEYFCVQSHYIGLFPAYFFMGINEEQITGGGTPAIYTTDYDYEANTIKRKYIYLRNTAAQTDTIIRNYNSEFVPKKNGYSVRTEGDGEKDTTEYIFDSKNRLIQAGDISYTYRDNGFTEKTGNVEFTYIFSKKGYLTDITGRQNNNSFGFEWSYSNRGIQENAISAFEADSVVWKSIQESNDENNKSQISETVLYGDTVINGIKWRLFYCYGEKGLLRTENKKVIYRTHPDYLKDMNDDAVHPYKTVIEWVIYDFSLEVGDSFDRYDLFGEVTDVDSVILNDGKKHKKITFKSGNSYIEGLGCTNLDPFIMLSPNPVPQTSSLMCCHINNELFYRNPDFSDCEGSRVDNETIENNPQKVKILQANGQLHIIFEENASFDVSVYNMQGMLVSQKNGCFQEATIPANNLPQAVCILRVTSGKYTYVQKIIKQ